MIYIRVTVLLILYWILIVWFHFIIYRLSFRFFCATARTFYDDYYNYRLILSSLLSKRFTWYAWKLINFLFTKLNCKIWHKIGFGFIPLWLTLNSLQVTPIMVTRQVSTHSFSQVGMTTNWSWRISYSKKSQKDYIYSMQNNHTVWYSLKQCKENWYKYTHVITLQYTFIHIIGEHTFIQWSISASMLISVCLDNIVSVS